MLGLWDADCVPVALRDEGVKHTTHVDRTSVDCVNWAVDWLDQMTINLFHQ